MNVSLPSLPSTNPIFPNFKHRELQFLQLACSELTYVQIADKMCVSPRTVDGYREVLFERLQVKSRVGLALWAVKTGLVVL
ncbi:response regulator transcription factor [Spirosoma endbachense]|uniref:Helix-turn-helix transcriptional regulator n=1 Tax=Spirosoma endbachense TaxID=2666025 RepID=A0A6P1VX45_9BACT|nr:helix-turn-helix transcriptional regulator [Spirosoma endbachense]QHV97683.1 helix-turn-helix transcriptional regulator [Spirosoma endbachense]